MNILLLTDRANWAYHSIAKALQKFNTDSNLSLDIVHIKKNIKHVKSIYRQYDRYLVMGWQNYEEVDFLPKSQTMLGIHSHHSFDDRKTTPDHDINPPKKLIDWLNEFKGINAVSLRLFKLFKNNGLTNIYYTPNGVDSAVFKPLNHKPSNDFTVGYSGSSSHDWRKGTSDFIIPAAKKAGVKTKLAMLATGSYVPLEDMPSFYHKIDAYICASLSEGFSLSVLEAASCGRPIITTKVGGTSELTGKEQTIYLVERDVDAFAEKITWLKHHPEEFAKLSNNIRNHVVNNLDWSKQSKAWYNFLSI